MPTPIRPGDIYRLRSRRFPKGLQVKVLAPIGGTTCYKVRMTGGEVYAYALASELS